MATARDGIDRRPATAHYGRGHPEQWRHAPACAVLLAATLLMFGDVLFAGHGRILSAEGQDLSSIFFYWDQFGFGELARGNLVLWNPYSFAGAPFLGGFQPGLLYPPNWLHLVLPTALAINAGIALHVFLAGVWVYLWTSHRGLHPAACVLAGFVFMFCGAHFLQLYSGHVPHLCSLVWAPLIFLAVDGVLEAPSVKWILVGIAAVAMQMLAGNIQYVYYTAIIAGLYTLLGWLVSPQRTRKAAALVTIAVGGASVAAVQLFTGLDAVTESLRAGLSYDLASSFPFPPENVVTLVFPGIFGDMIATPYWGRWALHEMSLFIGTAPFLLALCGAVCGDKRATRFSSVMALIALIIAFGNYTPIFAVLYDYLPGFRSVRVIARLTFLVSLFLAMLVAVGLDHLLQARRAPRWLTASALVLGAVAITAGSALVLDCRAGGHAIWKPTLASMQFFDEAFRAFAVEGSPASARACANTGGSLLIGGATFLLVGLLLLATGKARTFVYAVAMVGILELLGYARYSRPTFDPAPLVARSGAVRRLMEQTAAGESRVFSAVPYFYVAMSAGAHDIWAGADLVLGRYARFVALTQGWPPDAILVAPSLRKLSPLLGMLRLRYVLRIDGEQVRLVPTHLEELPRAALYSHWRVIPAPEQVLAAMGDPGFDPARVVLLENDPGLAPAASEERGSVSIVDVSTNQIDVQADVPEPAVLLLTDNYSAGWKATPLPGSSARSYRVMPANYTLRAIPLPAGRHHFRLEYRPTAFVIGTWVTVLSVLAYLSVACRFWWRRRHRVEERGRG
jgi:hypothetical protein